MIHYVFHILEYKGSVKQMVEAIRKDFKALYPDNILPKGTIDLFIKLFFHTFSNPGASSFVYTYFR